MDNASGQLASPLRMHKREASAIPARIDHSKRENSVSHSPHPSNGRPVSSHSHKRKSSRDRISSQERQLDHESIRAEQREVRNFLKFGAEEAVQAEHEAMLRVSEADQLLSKAKFEVLLQVLKTRS